MKTVRLEVMMTTSSKVKQFDFSKRGVEVDAVFKKLDADGYFDEIWKSYRDPATAYAYLVLSGKQTSGRKMKLALFRHLNDLKRSFYDDAFNYEYDLKQCHHILDYAKVCPDVESGKPMPLMVWQQAILCLLQGWRNESGEKRFTYALISVARTNGKTYLMNIILTYGYLIEAGNRKNLDFAYSGTTEQISKKGFRYLGSTIDYLAESQPYFRKRIKAKEINASADLIQSFKSRNQILRLTANSGKWDSYHCNTAVLDEYGDAAYDDDVLSKLSSGQIHQTNKQLIAISTAYENSNVPMFHDYQRLTLVIEKDNERKSETSLFLCWEQDSIDETDRPDTWEKSNPLLGLAEMHERLLKGLLDEKDKRESTGNVTWFQNRNLNMWLAVSKDKYLQLDDIQKSVVPNDSFTIDGRDVYVGLDLSRLDDDSSLAFIFPYFKGERQMMFVYQHSFVPTAHSQQNVVLKSKHDGINYSDAEAKGYADVARNADGLIDEQVIGDWFLDFIEEHRLNVKTFVYDAHLASPMVEWMNKNHPEIPFITLKQGSLSLDQPTRLLQKQFIRGLITMYDDPILEYSLTNAVLTSNNWGIKIDKAVHSAKIDCVDAIIDAISEAQYWYTSPNRRDVDDSAKHPFANMKPDEVNDYFKSDFGW